MNKNKLFLIFLSLIFSGIFLYSLNKYLILKKEVDSPISYRFVSTKVNSSARGKSYYLLVFYKGKEHEIAITSRDYADVNRKRYIKLYYSSNLKLVFSVWEVKKYLRISIIFSIMLAITCTSLVFVKSKYS
ncbi:hypothetical protein ACFSR6_03790 [Pedobacter vanadiisoli]|uniref:DUF3592 domain-containing protein n=1 Tax=Pedobacter vanadiisoli TaxID=1761975 RepID=A0ABW5MG35_9SPHI